MSTEALTTGLMILLGMNNPPGERMTQL